MVDKEGKGTAGLRVSIERSRRGRNQMVAMGGATDRRALSVSAALNFGGVR